MPATPDPDSLLARHREVMAPVIAFDTDIEAVSAQGLWVRDVNGRRWADFASGTAVTNLGHNHPEVVSAARAQLDRLVHSGMIFRYESVVQAAERLRDITPPGVDMFAFANSGSEALEAAVKLAKHSTGRQVVIAFRGGFHGRTMGSVSYTSSNAKYREGYHPLLGSVFIAPFPRPYRWGVSGEAALEMSVRELRMMLKHIVSPHEIACFLVEPVQGEGGYYPSPPAFLEEIRSIADDHGIMVVYDEVQTGFGRTAEWFASDHFRAKPDIIAMGKGIANGFPLSAYGAAQEIIGAWPVGSHGTTYGGNPVAAAAACAVIDAMEPLLPHARDLSKRAFEQFGKLAERHESIGEVRGLGLMIGVELVTDRDTRIPDAKAFRHVQAHAFEHELIIIDCGPDGNVIRFIPPLITTADELEWAVGLIDEGLDSWERRRG